MKAATSETTTHQKIDMFAWPQRAAKAKWALGEETIDMEVTFAISRDIPMVAPMTMKLVASVTMKEGRSVRTTTSPLISPIRPPAASASATIGQIGRPKYWVPIATIIEAAPTVEPIERSNSPAIIRMPTGMATMPSSAARLSQPSEPLRETKPAPEVTTAKKA